MNRVSLYWIVGLPITAAKNFSPTQATPKIQLDAGISRYLSVASSTSYITITIAGGTDQTGKRGKRLCKEQQQYEGQ